MKETPQSIQDPPNSTIHSDINSVNHSKQKKKSAKTRIKKSSKIKSDRKRGANVKTKCDYCDMMFDSFNPKRAHYIGRFFK